MMQTCLFSFVLFMTEAKSTTECIIFIPFHNNDKIRTSPVDPSFIFFTLWWWRRRCMPVSVFVCVLAHAHTHACITKWLTQPNPGRWEISHDAVERHSVWLTSEWGTARGLASRRDASWHVAESVILLARVQKNGADIYLILCSLASFRVESFWPWYHAAVSWAISWWYCHLSKAQVSTWIIMWSLANTVEHFCLLFLKPTFTLLSKLNMMLYILTF